MIIVIEVNEQEESTLHTKQTSFKLKTKRK